VAGVVCGVRVCLARGASGGLHGPSRPGPGPRRDDGGAASRGRPVGGFGGPRGVGRDRDARDRLGRMAGRPAGVLASDGHADRRGRGDVGGGLRGGVVLVAGPPTRDARAHGRTRARDACRGDAVGADAVPCRGRRSRCRAGRCDHRARRGERHAGRLRTRSCVDEARSGAVAGALHRLARAHARPRRPHGGSRGVQRHVRPEMGWGGIAHRGRRRGVAEQRPDGRSYRRDALVGRILARVRRVAAPRCGRTGGQRPQRGAARRARRREGAAPGGRGTGRAVGSSSRCARAGHGGEGGASRERQRDLRRGAVGVEPGGRRDLGRGGQPLRSPARGRARGATGRRGPRVEDGSGRRCRARAGR
jgi:hypothetical protein